MKIRRIVSLLLVLLALFSLCACSDSEKEQLARSIIFQGKTWYGKSDREQVYNKNTASQSTVKYNDQYWITFNEDNTFTARVETVTKCDDKYVTKNLRGRTEKKTEGYEGTWSITAKDQKATVKLKSSKSLGVLPEVYTLNLIENNTLHTFYGTNSSDVNVFLTWWEISEGTD